MQCPAQPANVKAIVPVTDTTSLSLPIMPGIHQDYVTRTSVSVGHQKVPSGDFFVPESDVECSNWLSNVMSDDRQHDVHPVTNTCSSLLPMPLMPGLQQDYFSHAVPAQMLGQSSQRQSHPPIMASTHTPLLQRAFSEPSSRYNRLSSPIPYGSDFGSFNIVQVGGDRIHSMVNLRSLRNPIQLDFKAHYPGKLLFLLIPGSVKY